MNIKTLFSRARLAFVSAGLCVCLLTACSQVQQSAQQLNQHLSVNNEQLLISDNAFSGSSVNVLAGVKQTVFTHQQVQYTAFYDAEAKLVIAKRNLNQSNWQIKVTDFTGNVNDAHNHISLVVDGNGYIHVAWDHHNSKLKYARSATPGSLDFIKLTMLAKPGQEKQVEEHSVTYPQFYRLNNGDLIFAYRNGGSGRGNLILNNYDVNTQQWQRLHDSLIDGEGKRSAYWDMTIDENGILHLAWIWRETPDVATNHDISYAQSLDNGQTWQTINGKAYQLPIIEKTSDVVKHIPQNHKLMNPPVVTADSQSNPFIASYWADTPTDKPRFHVLYAQKQVENKGSDSVQSSTSQWQHLKAPKVTENFELSGHGTKRPPISRASLLIDTSSDTHTRRLHLIYRSDFHNSHVVALTLNDLTDVNWQLNTIANSAVGAWEPSIDIAQWHQYKQAHLLMQNVGQDDGNDAQSLTLAPSKIKLLIWQP